MTSLNKSEDTSLSSAADMNETSRPNQQLQRYSITCHSVYPVIVCSDGFLMCVLRLGSAYATQPRLIRELMNNSIGLLNTLSDKPVDVIRAHSGRDGEDSDGPVPDWDLQTHQSGAESAAASSADSGVDSNEKNNTERRRSSQTKIAEGKIIFSFLPQIIPVSMQTLEQSRATRVEYAFESLQAAWALLTSMQTARALLDTAECDRTAKSVLLVFTRFAKLLLNMDWDDFKSLNAFKQGLLLIKTFY